MTDYIIQFDLKEQNQTEHSRFLGQQLAFFFKKNNKKKQKRFLRKTVQTLVIQKIFTGLFFFLKNKKQRERAL